MLQTIDAQIAAVTSTVISPAILFPQLCTLQAPNGIFIDAGQPSGNYVDVTGLVDIPCTAQPLSTSRPGGMEAKTMGSIQAFNPLVVQLNGFYPAINDGVGLGWRAVIDGIPYDLLASNSDSQSQMTMIEVRSSAL